MAYTYKHGDRPLEGYTIQRAVGSGGFGQVYYALSDGGREVALKYLKDNPQVELRGVSHCINLKSPHLISIFDVKKSTEGEYFLVMEYCSGPSLRDLLIAEPNGFGVQKAAFFVREIAKGLAYLHDRGIVHRDLKPGNIFFDDGYVKIGDYGLSKFISISRHSAQTASVGTVHYMAPEIGSGNYSRGVDIYALGVILYEMLLGRVPFEGSTMGEVLMKHLTAQPAVDQLPHPFAHVIRKALQKDPNDRYQNVNEMIEELLAVEDIQMSLAGFSVKSLEGAVRRGTTDALASPFPSPNPSPRYGPVVEIPVRPGNGPPPYDPTRYPLPPRIAKKVERIANRVERKIARLGGRPAGDRAQAAPVALPGNGAGPGGPVPAMLGRIGPVSVGKRLLLSLFLTVGLSVILGVIIAGVAGPEEVGVSASMQVLAMWGGILLSRKAAHWFGVDAGPRWSERLVGLLCCGPLLAIGAAPALELDGSDALGMLLGLMVVAVFTKWDVEFSEGAAGELRFGTAVRAAFFAFIAAGIGTAMSDGKPEYMAVAASVAGVVSLCLQPAAWWLGGRQLEQSQSIGQGSAPLAGNGASMTPNGGPPGLVNPPIPPLAPSGPFHSPMASPPAEKAATSEQVQIPLPRRWGITRVFWALLSFVFMSGAIVTFLIPLVLDSLSRPEVVQSVTTCIFLLAATLFSLAKTTAIKRDGFWRETLHPFLIACSFFGIGATITVLAGGTPGPKGGQVVFFDEPEEELRAAQEALSRVQARVGPFQLDVEAPVSPLPPDECDDSQLRLLEQKTRRDMRQSKWDRGRAQMERVGHRLSEVIRLGPGTIHWGRKQTAACIVGLVFSSLMFITLLVFSGRRRRRQAPFVQTPQNSSD